MMMRIKEILTSNSIRQNISIGLTALQKQREKITRKLFPTSKKLLLNLKNFHLLRKSKLTMVCFLTMDIMNGALSKEALLMTL